CRIVAARGEPTGVLHVQIGNGRSLEHTAVNTVIARSRLFGDADATFFERRIPDPDIERVEIAQCDARLRVANETRADDAGFREAVAVEPAADTVVDSDEDVIGVFVAGIEVWFRPVP